MKNVIFLTEHSLAQTPDTKELRVLTAHIQYYKRSVDTTLVYVVTRQEPLKVVEFPKAIDKMLGGKK